MFTGKAPDGGSCHAIARAFARTTCGPLPVLNARLIDILSAGAGRSTVRCRVPRKVRHELAIGNPSRNRRRLAARQYQACRRLARGPTRNGRGTRGATALRGHGAAIPSSSPRSHPSTGAQGGGRRATAVDTRPNASISDPRRRVAGKPQSANVSVKPSDLVNPLPCGVPAYNGTSALDADLASSFARVAQAGAAASNPWRSRTEAAAAITSNGRSARSAMSRRECRPSEKLSVHSTAMFRVQASCRHRWRNRVRACQVEARPWGRD